MANGGAKHAGGDQPRGMSDALALLEVDITYPDWENETGLKKSYYVRGFTWFRNEVLRDRLYVTDCASYIPEMKKLLKERKGWRKLDFKWEEDFSPRQFIDTASLYRKLTPKFHKAAEVILLCEVIARDLHAKDSKCPTPEMIYERMRIEPALSYINGFDRQIADRLSSKELDDLRAWTGQEGNEVFIDMANGHTVTHKLATRTREFLAARVPGIKLGDVGFRLRKRVKLGISSNEFVDIDVGKLPASLV